MSDSSSNPYDVVVVGGGPAGLSAAIMLGRSRRSVVVIDAGEPRNAPSPGAHNVLSRDGVAPGELLAIGRREAASYGVEIIDGRAVTAERAAGLLTVGIDDGRTVTGRRLLLASGLRDELPDVPGLAQGWGTSVLHCPYCHGWEVRDRRIGILAGSANSLHHALMFRQLSDDVTFIAHAVTLEPEQAEQLRAVGITIVEGQVDHVVGAGSALSGVVLRDGRSLDLDALVVAPRFVARTELYEQLGGVPRQEPFGVSIPTEPGGRTAVAGVFAVGNAAEAMATVMPAAAAGVGVGGMINADLIAEDTRAAVERLRAAEAGRAGGEVAAVLG